MIRPVWQVFRFELLRNLRRRTWQLAAIAVPLLALLASQGLNLEGAIPGVNLPGINTPAFLSPGSDQRGLVDETGLFPVRDGSAGPGSLRLFADAAAATLALESGDVGSWYHIPGDYLERGIVYQVMPALDLSEMSRGVIRRHILWSLQDEVDSRLLERLERPMRLSVVREQEGSPGKGPGPGWAGEEFALLLVYPFVLALMFSLFMTSGYLLQGVIEEKETRVIEILLSSLQPGQLFAGKVLAYGTLGLIQLIFWLAGILLVLQRLPLQGALSALAQFVLPEGALPLLLVYFALAYLLFASAYGILGALSASMREGPQYAVIFTLPAVVPLWLSTAFIEAPDGPLVLALSLFPLTAPLAMLQRVLISAVPAWQVALSITLLLLCSAALMWLAGRVFRVQTLLAGRMPRLRELPGLLRNP
ncbi:MAG: ABC transporter permease [Anaerolineaceae bacterium]|nr:ABC transporter permease [Anaerolineaceae bacterium]